jgi:hypothetical protein
MRATKLKRSDETRPAAPVFNIESVRTMKNQVLQYWSGIVVEAREELRFDYLGLAHAL